MTTWKYAFLCIGFLEEACIFISGKVLLQQHLLVHTHAVLTIIPRVKLIIACLQDKV